MARTGVISPVEFVEGRFVTSLPMTAVAIRVEIPLSRLWQPTNGLTIIDSRFSPLPTTNHYILTQKWHITLTTTY